MTRTITSTVNTASLASNGYAWTLAAELDFESGFVRVHTGAGTITFPDSTQYEGIGGLGTVSTIEDPINSQASPIQLSLSGLDGAGANISSVFNENLRGRSGTIYLVCIDNSTGAVAADPVVIGRGRLDTFTITQGDTMSVGVIIENIIAQWDRTADLRYTNEQQQSRYPADKGLEFTAEMVQATIHWGRG